MLKPILIDLDGTLCDFVQGYYEMASRERYKKLLGVLPEKEEITTFYIEDSIPRHLLTEHVKTLARDIVNEVGLFINLKPFDNAIEGSLQLERETGRKIFFVSAPHTSNIFSYSEKAMWIKKYYGSAMMDRLILCRDKTLVSGIVLIDDKPSPMGEYHPDWEHIVFDQTYNKTDIETKGKRRMFSWSEEQVLGLVKYLEGKK